MLRKDRMLESVVYQSIKVEGREEERQEAAKIHINSALIFA